ncbi:hypothetical protein [Lachnospira pectinoschiza]|uniref:Uncharacterized protein n=1 Tax=Lachnospira pectinoschiza TaxID=28052 RepID=A0A1G9SQQ2_9FIRM|nr:hypothetical protein [Lachnospira pectinoschiza]SDM37185.1 hypothetical protein SAMN05216544_0036 [Lachnospira pectinoschiza]
MKISFEADDSFFLKLINFNFYIKRKAVLISCVLIFLFISPIFVETIYYFIINDKLFIDYMIYSIIASIVYVNGYKSVKGNFKKIPKQAYPKLKKYFDFEKNKKVYIDYEIYKDDKNNLFCRLNNRYIFKLKKIYISENIISNKKKLFITKDDVGEALFLELSNLIKGEIPEEKIIYR